MNMKGECKASRFGVIVKNATERSRTLSIFLLYVILETNMVNGTALYNRTSNKVFFMQMDILDILDIKKHADFNYLLNIIVLKEYDKKHRDGSFLYIFFRRTN